LRLLTWSIRAHRAPSTGALLSFPERVSAELCPEWDSNPHAPKDNGF
jgi:hypothetical protein